MIWKTIPSHPNYEASSTGLIRSKAITVRVKRYGKEHNKRKPQRLMSIKEDYRGRHIVAISLKSKANGTYVFVHRLIAEAFLGDIEGKHIHHKDRNVSNNNIDNLQIIDSKDHKALHENCPDHRRRGHSINTAILTEIEVVEIKKRLQNYKLNMVADLAEEYHVSPQVIGHIRRGLTWAHVKI